MHIHFSYNSPAVSTRNTVLACTKDALIAENEFEYILSYNHMKNIQAVHIRKDLSNAVLVVSGPFNEDFRHELYLALRVPFALLAQKNNMVLLHSASCLYNEKLYCFSAPSGTGKTTHTNLWKELLSVPLINGDLNLLKVSDNTVSVPGTPWCGTSGIFAQGEYPLGGIIFLKQAPEDRALTLQPEDAFPKLYARLMSPAWTEALADINAEMSAAISSKIPMWTLECTPTANAVYAIKAEIDRPVQ